MSTHQLKKNMIPGLLQTPLGVAKADWFIGASRRRQFIKQTGSTGTKPAVLFMDQRDPGELIQWDLESILWVIEWNRYFEREHPHVGER